MTLSPPNFAEMWRYDFSIRGGDLEGGGTGFQRHSEISRYLAAFPNTLKNFRSLEPHAAIR